VEGKDLDKKNIWMNLSKAELTQVFDFSKGYIEFLNQAKTEREAIDYIEKAAKQNQFENLHEVSEIKSGQKLFVKYKHKVCALITVGTNPISQGVNMVVSHIDSPRLDLKARPLYEADGIALLKTHYYGGIKKYQWLGIPLALHGVVIRKDGTQVTIVIGEEAGDPVFTIADLLPHLAKDQMEKKMSEAIKGEDLNVIIGSLPLKKQNKESIKHHILKILEEKYGIKEDDFTSAELEIVPAFKANDTGLDRSMVGAYGQDDRVSAYTSLQAILQTRAPEKTAICLFADKEEIGSAGNTGLQSLIVENIMAELLYKSGVQEYYAIRKSLEISSALSADVNAAVDPNYPEVFDKMNCSFLGQGVVVTKYTGSRGKADSNDANPEFIGKIRALFDENQVAWQVGELGKVDIGGGGTVAQYLARYGMEVIDCGVALLGMHSPFEIASKADIYMAYRAYGAFMQKF
jgi:aspartyl aminopeptidase